MGFDHVVANMFFLPLGHFIGTAGLGWGDVVNNLVFAFLGNMVGAGVFVAGLYWFLHLRDTPDRPTPRRSRAARRRRGRRDRRTAALSQQVPPGGSRRAQPARPEGSGHRGRTALLLLAGLAGVGLLLRRARRPAPPPPAPAPGPVAVPQPPDPWEAAVRDVRPDAGPVPAVPGRPRLVAVAGGTVPHSQPHTPPEVLLRPGLQVVGRAEDADLRVPDPTVSPRHVALTVSPGGEVELRDLGTVNGVTVDGVPVVRTQLHDGNRVELGNTRLVFRADAVDDDGGRQGGELGEQPQHREQGTD